MDRSVQVLSDLTVYMKYAKYIPELKRRETFREICDRNMEMHIRTYPELAHEIQDVYEKFIHTKKILPSMRSMQFAGKPVEITPSRIFNCGYLPIDDAAAFGEVMFLLLGGTGIGFSVQEHHIEKLPEIKKPNPNRTRRYLISDSIEGWADAIKALMKSFFNGTSTLKFDFRDIRPKGATLITSGGKAPGPEPLRICITKIGAILREKEEGDKLTSFEVHRIICLIADAVLAGGIRRAALISLFTVHDEEMLNAKAGNWWELYPELSRANNSAVMVRRKLTEEVFKKTWKRTQLAGTGEPGVYLTNDKNWGTNPCVTGDTVLDVKIGEDFVRMHMKDVIIMVLEGVDIYTKSYDTTSGEIVYSKITDAALTKKDAEIVKITDTRSGNSIKCTPDHKVYTKNRGWIEAQYLQAEDELVIN